jgi:iron complex transport system ATP-binding protein
VRHPGATRDAVRDLSLAVHGGEIVALVGPNGSGKSTTLAALGRALEVHAGAVLVDGADVRSFGRRGLARRLARLPQSPSHAEGVTVEDLVRCGRYAHVGFLAPLGAADRAAVDEAVRAMDIGDLRSRRLETLSGGERRRAWLAMVLAQRADLLLLDEPTAALDLRHQWEVLDVVRRIHRERGATIVVVLHDLEQAAAIADRVAVLHRGRLYRAGPPEECIEPETLRDVFGVAARVTVEEGRRRVAVLGPQDPRRRL